MQSESFDEVLQPDFGVVFYVLTHHLVKVFTDDEPLVTYPADYARNQHHVILFLLAVL